MARWMTYTACATLCGGLLLLTSCAALRDMHLRQLEETVVVEEGASLPAKGSFRIASFECSYARETLPGWAIPGPCRGNGEARGLARQVRGDVVEALTTRGFVRARRGAAAEPPRWELALVLELIDDSTIKSAKLAVTATDADTGAVVWRGSFDSSVSGHSQDFADATLHGEAKSAVSFVFHAFDYRRDPAAYRSSLGI